ncbi:MAG: hypothetical protein HRU38_08920 [Saccharospirillaceae bacterium]|nr:hypothetical protein [Pseudomonadales bacterium]NRB78776.1 hypothetical protein [Saccharospirillaceae bacterium]
MDINIQLNEKHSNLKLAKKEDKQIIHKIIMQSFSHDVGFKWLLESTKNPKKP